MTTASETRPVSIVTGAGRGIGRGIAEVLARAGHAVVVWEIDGDQARATAAELAALGSEADSREVDVTEPDQVRAACGAAVERFGRIDGLVNDAIVIRRGRLEDLPLEDWAATLAVGLTATFLCSQVVGRVMLAQRRGAIVNIASVSAVHPQPLLGSYSATKAGVVALTQQTAVEWGPRGVRCNSISPGMVRTTTSEAVYRIPELYEQRRTLVPLDRLASPAEMGNVVEFLLSDASSYINGANVMVDGGLSLTLVDNMPSVAPDGSVIPGPISRTSPMTI